MRSDIIVKTIENLAQDPCNCQMDWDNSDSDNEYGEALDTKVLQKWRESLGESALEFMMGIVDIFVEEAPKKLRAIAIAVAKGDMAALEHQANSFKSSSAALGATKLSKLCQYLESNGRGGSRPDDLGIAIQLYVEYARCKSALYRELQKFQAESNAYREKSFF
ncbi:Hpt domain-containing protein [Funiculus sociatus GB2-A5]|uniref:Hpt domain-containing protein n=1 Tax=Funiculus sociatus GB2-A5 TaxID=2933946 RepID=A0ABV0JPS2_9CYAN|nr:MULTISPECIES: Hpt domain-containing protein [unclassified Trichocoleus]MBD1908016.1 Hpt domain-containing protein [Trichocoleus sp. FACHB-832]MBD2061572.1 Hpt domain-containing protein [Trichocoleus sp. FACHB-6]